DRFENEGVAVQEIIATGGISKKSPYVMQVLADVLDRPIKTVKTEQACALGAAMYAAVVAGIHPDIDIAQQTMSPGFEHEYHPDPERVAVYRQLYHRYQQLADLHAAAISYNQWKKS